jgi:hypothetical protein
MKRLLRFEDSTSSNEAQMNILFPSHPPLFDYDTTSKEEGKGVGM